MAPPPSGRVDHGTGIAARLGRVFYWLGTTIAVAFALWALVGFGVALTVGVTSWTEFLDPFHRWRMAFEPTVTQSGMIALLAWIIGKAARYVLSGE